MYKARMSPTAVALVVAVGTSTAYAAPSSTGSFLTSGQHPIHLVHEGHGGAAQASGVVNAVDAAQHKVNLSHGSIKALGWPAMTMDFPVSPGIDLAAVTAGAKVNFTLVRAADGSWVVDTLQPASGR
jgi:Cu/Ag efflux protein CusF